MNSKQKLVLSIFIIVTIGMMLYPPFQITIKGTEINMGYGFLLDPPKKSYLNASVNASVLVVQWIAAVLVGAVGWVLLKGDANVQPVEPGERNPDNKSLDVSCNQKGEQMSEEKNLEGIGGWLVLVAIGIVISPIRLFMLIIKTYPEIFSTGVWEALRTQGSEAYNPLLALIIILEILLNSAVILASLYMCYKFFTKSRDFPEWFIGIAIFTLLFILADAFATKFVLPSEPIFHPDTIKEFMRSLIVVVIWVPYMLVSKRVKATFVK